MSEPQELQHRERHSRGGCFIVGFLVLLLGYVLSPPFAEMAREHLPRQLETVLIYFYTPLAWLYENTDAFENFYDWYLELF